MPLCRPPTASFFHTAPQIFPPPTLGTTCLRKALYWIYITGSIRPGVSRFAHLPPIHRAPSQEIWKYMADSETYVWWSLMICKHRFPSSHILYTAVAHRTPLGWGPAGWREAGPPWLPYSCCCPVAPTAGWLWAWRKSTSRREAAPSWPRHSSQTEPGSQGSQGDAELPKQRGIIGR